MDNIIIRKLERQEKPPFDLLLLADPSIEMINKYLNRGTCYIACIEDNVVGIYVMVMTKPLTFEITNIAVDENWQGKGIGKMLLMDAINRARNENAKLLEIGTGNSSLSQLSLYQKCSFRITGVDRDFFKRNYKEKIIENGIECIDMVRLRLEL